MLPVLAVLTGLAVSSPARLAAQPDSGAPSHGSNYDPAPPPPKAEAKPPQAPPPEDGFRLPLNEIDWADKENWVKLGLLVGSIVLARRAFRQMKGEE